MMEETKSKNFTPPIEESKKSKLIKDDNDTPDFLRQPFRPYDAPLVTG